jgi:hypothetical protein
MFESLQFQIGCDKDRDEIDKYHILISLIIRHQSEHDFPHGAMRNGLIDRGKCHTEERRGNLFLLLCIAQMLEGSEILQKGLQYSQHKWVEWLKFVKLYLLMEEWFHNSNDQVEVDNAKPLIGEVPQTLQALFPREDKTNGYCIPNMHRMTNFNGTWRDMVVGWIFMVDQEKQHIRFFESAGAENATLCKQICCSDSKPVLWHYGN